MAEVETPAAESSPAAPATPESTPAAEPVSVPKDPEAYAEWRQTGKLPEKDAKPSKREDSATSKKTSVDSEEESESATVSETVPLAGKKNAQKRIDQLTAEKESFRRELEELKARTGKQDAKKPESSSVPSAPDELKRPERPKQENFDDWDSYEKAQDKYLEDLADFKAAKRLEEHTERQRHETATKEMQARLDQAKERYGQEAETKITDTAKTIFADDKVAPALKAAIGRSDVIVDALYVMGSDADELSEFLTLAKADPIEALRKWFTVEALIKEELKSGNAEKANGATARGPDGKFLPEKPAKRVEAPPPTRVLGGNSSPPGDERERAAKTGDFRAFKADADRRDMQRFRGQ